MYQAMKRHSLLAVLPRLIPALALALALLILTGGSVVNMILGPENLNTLGDNVKVGDYVEFDMSQLISPYATYSNTESGEVYDAYYIVKIAEGTYLSLHTGGDQMDSLERATDQAYDYYMNNSGILNPMGMISGEIRTLDGEQQTLLLEWLTGSRVEGFESGEESTGTAMALDVDLGKLGGMTYLWNWILFALGLAALAYAVVLLWQVFSGSFYRQVTQELGDSADAAQDWQNAESFGNARVGRNYIWYARGARSYVFSFHSVVWVYKQFDSRVLGKFKWPVSIFTDNRSYHELCVQEDSQREQLIQILRDHGGKFVAGYNQDNYEQFCNNFKAFCARAAAGDPDADAPLIKLPD